MLLVVERDRMGRLEARQRTRRDVSSYSNRLPALAQIFFDWVAEAFCCKLSECLLDE